MTFTAMKETNIDTPTSFHRRGERLIGDETINPQIINNDCHKNY